MPNLATGFDFHNRATVRICLLSARFPPQRCGVGDYTYFLANALGRIGHEVHVLTAVGELDEPLYPLSSNVSLHRVIRSWGMTGLPDVIKHLKKIDPHIVTIQYTPHAFDRRGITLAVNLIPAIVRAVGICRVVTNIHELNIPFDRSLIHNLGALWQRFAGILLAAGSNALTVTTSVWEGRLTGMGIQKEIQVIPVGSNIPRTRIDAEHRKRLRAQLLGTSEGFLVMGFGSSHDRDVPALLYGLGQLKREWPTKLVWVGGGIPGDRQRAGIAQAMQAYGLDDKDVEWTGALPHPEVSKLLNVCDLMVLPFIDGVSTRRTSAVTALQHGMPLLTTRGGCCAPWFVHLQNAYLVSANDKQALADGLVELARQPELRSRIARGAQATYETLFAWDVIGRQVDGLLQHASSFESQPN